MITLFGIKNCDTVKKARKWLEAQGVEYRFHDFRTDGLDEKRLQTWTRELGWENLLNRRGTTWRGLNEAQRDALDEAKAIALMLEHPALIKRPVLDTGKTRYLGFQEDSYKALTR